MAKFKLANNATVFETAAEAVKASFEATGGDGESLVLVQREDGDSDESIRAELQTAMNAVQGGGEVAQIGEAVPANEALEAFSKILSGIVSRIQEPGKVAIPCAGGCYYGDKGVCSFDNDTVDFDAEISRCREYISKLAARTDKNETNAAGALCAAAVIELVEARKTKDLRATCFVHVLRPVLMALLELEGEKDDQGSDE